MSDGWIKKEIRRFFGKPMVDTTCVDCGKHFTIEVVGRGVDCTRCHRCDMDTHIRGAG
jgi:hypothetical protein